MKSGRSVEISSAPIGQTAALTQVALIKSARHANPLKAERPTQFANKSGRTPAVMPNNRNAGKHANSHEVPRPDGSGVARWIDCEVRARSRRSGLSSSMPKGRSASLRSRVPTEPRATCPTSRSTCDSPARRPLSEYV